MLVEKIESVCVWFIVDCTEKFPALTDLLEVAIVLVEKFETVCVLFIVDGEEKLWLLVEENRSGKILEIFIVELPTSTNLVEVAVMLVEKIESVCIWFIVDCKEKLRLLVDVLEIFAEEFLTLTNMLGAAIMLVERFETVCVWFIVNGEEKLWLLVEGNRNGEVLDIFTIEFSPLTNLIEVAIVLADKFETVWVIVNGEEKLCLLMDRKMGDEVLDIFIEEFPTLTNLLEVAIMLVEKTEIKIDRKEKLELLVEGNWSSEVLNVFTKEVPKLTNLLEVVIMLVDKFETACVWFTVNCEEKLRLFVEDKSSGVVLEIFTLDIGTEEFPLLTNLLEVSVIFVDKYDTVCVWFAVDCKEKLGFLLEGDISGGALDMFTIEFFTLKSLLEVIIMLVEKIETVWFLADNDEIFWFLVEGKSNDEVLEIFTKEFSTLMNLLEVAIMLLDKYETVCFTADSDEKLWKLVEGKSSDGVLDMFTMDVFTKEFPTLMNLLEVAIMLADEFETFCVWFIVDCDEKL